MIVDLTSAEIEALLWLESIVAHAFSRDEHHPAMGASATAAGKLEAELEKGRDRGR